MNVELLRSDLRFVSLASGSGGNASVVSAGDHALLVDCGISCKQVVRRMQTAGLNAEQLRAIAVTHEHSDHVAGIRVTAQRLGLPVYMTAACAQKVALPGDIEVRHFQPGVGFQVGDLEVEPYRIPHDTVDPVGFVVGCGDDRVGICTDLGSVTRLVIEKLRSCRVVLLEFNHDTKMLLDGPYPWHLKQRVRGRHGHLSNDQAGQLLEKLGQGMVEVVLLAHLSGKNNRPELALRAAQAALLEGHSRPVRLELLTQDEPGPLIPVRAGASCLT
jgi:phosphoribosyl 1,2-cyclic phosphodiesterase